jgi:hypothetical protein
MKKVKRTIQTYKSTPITRNISVYIARNGREFETEKKCLDYEKQLDYQDKFDKIKKVVILDDSFFADTWFYAGDEEELEMIKRHFDYMDSYNNVKVNGLSKKNGDLKVGDWIAMEYSDGGDYRGDRYFYTLSYIMDCVSSFQNSFMST